MTKGQRAMVAALADPEPAKGGRGNSVQNTEISGNYLSRARTILRHAPNLAGQVRNGDLPLDAAYAKACEALSGQTRRARETTSNIFWMGPLKRKRSQSKYPPGEAGVGKTEKSTLGQKRIVQCTKGRGGPERVGKVGPFARPHPGLPGKPPRAPGCLPSPLPACLPAFTSASMCMSA
jgi:hypothetical protein